MTDLHESVVQFDPVVESFASALQAKIRLYRLEIEWRMKDDPRWLQARYGLMYMRRFAEEGPPR